MRWPGMKLAGSPADGRDPAGTGLAVPGVFFPHHGFEEGIQHPLLLGAEVAVLAGAMSASRQAAIESERARMRAGEGWAGFMGVDGSMG